MPAFDPYYKWLGIPPEEQPPNHYRLLGINLFEADAAVISNAADQRMAFLKSVQTGEHVQHSQDLLNQVAQAKLCLLDAGKRRAYDATLGDRQTAFLKKDQDRSRPQPTSGPGTVPPKYAVDAGDSMRRGAPPRTLSGVPPRQSLFSRIPSWALVAVVSGALVLVVSVLLRPGTESPDPPDGDWQQERDELLAKVARLGDLVEQRNRESQVRIQDLEQERDESLADVKRLRELVKQRDRELQRLKDNTEPPPESLVANLKVGLVAYYPFNGNAKDESGNGHDGTVHGGVTLTTDRHGRTKQSYSFNGSGDFISVPDHDELDLGNAAGKQLTVSLWFNVKLDRNNDLISKSSGDSRVTDYYLFIENKGPGIVWGTGPSSMWGGDSANAWTCTGVYPSLRTWHHVVATYDNSENGVKRVYLDGTLIMQTGIGKKNPSNSTPLRMGGGYSGDIHFEGLLDDIRIYNRALSTREVKALYDHESKDPKSISPVPSAIAAKSKRQKPTNIDKDLIAYYPFNGNSKDESGHGHDGTVKGATLTVDRHGVERNAYKFNGVSDRIEIKPLASQAISSITFAGWIRTRETRGSRHIFSNYSQDDARANWFHILLSELGPAGHCAVQIDHGEPDISPPYLVATKPTSDEKWHHIVATWDSADGKLSIYLDGRQDVSRDVGIKSPLYLLKYPTWIGAQDLSVAPRGFKGSIDDIRIYNRALSAREVKALYGYESSPPPKITKRKTRLRRISATPPLAVAPFDERQAKAHQAAWARHVGTRVEISNSIGMKLKLIPPGEFTMGSPESEEGRRDNEKQHLVRITKPFYLSAHEVTQAQYESVMQVRPWKDKGYVTEGLDYPATYVTWDDAVDFCQKLSEAEKGVEYRLPTEAEWEYACRVGTTSAYSFDGDASQLGNYAWYRTNAWYIGEKYAHRVGQKTPNPWGLYDMHGNACEWCWDWYGTYENKQMLIDPSGPASGSRRVLRGGAFNDPAENVRAAYRINTEPNSRYRSYGFRLAKTCDLSPITSPTVDKPTPTPAPPKMSRAQRALAAPIKKHMTPKQKDLGGPIVNSIDIILVPIPAGEFTMGSPESEPDRRDNETQHKVRITKPFYLSAHEVTQAQYERVMGNNPSYFKGPTKPVEQVNWNDAVAFCDELSKREGEKYRLPTEAQWEYACRAGTTTAYSFGDDVRQLPQHAWYSGSSNGSTHPVGKKLPNPWGLFDMHGNVWEWCEDWYGTYETKQMLINPSGPASGSRRVLRGGPFVAPPKDVRAASRNLNPPDYRYLNNGFRLTRTYNLSP